MVRFWLWLYDKTLCWKWKLTVENCIWVEGLNLGYWSWRQMYTSFQHHLTCVLLLFRHTRSVSDSSCFQSASHNPFKVWERILVSLFAHRAWILRHHSLFMKFRDQAAVSVALILSLFQALAPTQLFCGHNNLVEALRALASIWWTVTCNSLGLHNVPQGWNPTQDLCAVFPVWLFTFN